MNLQTRLLTDSSKCHLLGGYLSDAIQLGLGLCAIGSLVYKRHVERPQRPWNIWCFDVSKQLVGGFIVHCSNIYVAELLGAGDDECAWYFLNFFVDCTIGVLIVFLVHGFLCSVLKKFHFTSFHNIGDYGDPPNKYVWAAQCGVYIASLLVNKLIVCSLFFVALAPVNDFADWLFAPLWPTPELELVVVMVMCPFLLTSLQFLMFDYMLKAKSPNDEKEELGFYDNGQLGSSLLLGEESDPSSKIVSNNSGPVSSSSSNTYLSMGFKSTSLPTSNDIKIEQSEQGIGLKSATIDSDSV